jgi:hypothetical protein
LRCHDVVRNDTIGNHGQNNKQDECVNFDSALSAWRAPRLEVLALGRAFSGKS